MVLADHNVKLKEHEKKDKYLDLGRELINCGIWIIIVIGALGTGTGGLGNKRVNGDHQNNSIEIGQNTEESPGDLRRLTIT